MSSWGPPAWMFNYEESSHEIMRADDAPTAYRVCKTCLCLVSPWDCEGHYEYHRNRGDLGA